LHGWREVLSSSSSPANYFPLSLSLSLSAIHCIEKLLAGSSTSGILQILLGIKGNEGSLENAIEDRDSIETFQATTTGERKKKKEETLPRGAGIFRP
jgi:hypothetical protein